MRAGLAASLRWLPILALIGALVVLAHVIDPRGIPTRYRESTDVAHVVGFAILTFMLTVAAARFAGRHGLRKLPVLGGAVVLVLALALVSEFAQTFTGRDSSIADLVRDASGVVGGALAAVGIVSGRPRVALPLVIVGLISVWSASRTQLRTLMSTALLEIRDPLTVDFDSPFDEPIYGTYNAVAERVAAGTGWPNGGEVLRVSGTAGSAAAAFHRFPPDWRRWSTLSFFAATADGADTVLTVRVHDTAHDGRYRDRFNEAFEIGPVPGRIVIDIDDIRRGPTGRELNLERVAGLIIFVDASLSGGFLIDDLTLE